MAVNIHHLEYDDGGILDMDDMISDLVEDREKVRKSWMHRSELFFLQRPIATDWKHVYIHSVYLVLISIVDI